MTKEISTSTFIKYIKNIKNCLEKNINAELEFSIYGI